MSDLEGYNNYLLPGEILNIIFSFINIETIIEVIPYVCTTWRHVCSSIIKVNRIYRDMYGKDILCIINTFSNSDFTYDLDKIDESKKTDSLIEIASIFDIYTFKSSLFYEEIRHWDNTSYWYPKWTNNQIKEFLKYLNKIQNIDLNTSAVLEHNSNKIGNYNDMAIYIDNSVNNIITFLDYLSYYETILNKITFKYFDLNHFDLFRIINKCKNTELNIECCTLDKFNYFKRRKHKRINEYVNNIYFEHILLNNDIIEFINSLVNLKNLSITDCMVKKCTYLNRNYKIDIETYYFSDIESTFDNLEIINVSTDDEKEEKALEESNFLHILILNSPKLKELYLDLSELDKSVLIQILKSMTDYIYFEKLVFSQSSINEINLGIIIEIFKLLTKIPNFKNLFINLSSVDPIYTIKLIEEVKILDVNFNYKFHLPNYLFNSKSKKQYIDKNTSEKEAKLIYGNIIKIKSRINSYYANTANEGIW